MTEEWKENRSAFASYESGEKQMIRIVKSMIGDEPITTLVMQKLQPEQICTLPTRPLLHFVHDMDSFCAWMRWYPELTVNAALIFVDTANEDIICYPHILADKAFPGNADDKYGCLGKCVYGIEEHVKYSLWMERLNNNYSLKDFTRFIVRHQKDIVNPGELLDSWSRIKTAIDLTVETQYVNGTECVVSFTSKTGSKTSENLLKEFRVCIPVLRGYEDEPMEFTINIEINEPEKADRPEATFSLYSEEMEDAKRKAIEDVAERIRLAFPEFTVLNGSHGWKK